MEGVPKVPDFKIDVTENEQGYVVRTHIPSVKKDDIQVAIDGNSVSISAEAKRQSEQKDGENVIHSERYFGRLSRSFALGSEIDASQSQAKYTDGALELNIYSTPIAGLGSASRLAPFSLDALSCHCYSSGIKPIS